MIKDIPYVLIPSYSGCGSIFYTFFIYFNLEGYAVCLPFLAVQSTGQKALSFVGNTTDICLLFIVTSTLPFSNLPAVLHFYTLNQLSISHSYTHATRQTAVLPPTLFLSLSYLHSIFSFHLSPTFMISLALSIYSLFPSPFLSIFL